MDRHQLHLHPLTASGLTLSSWGGVVAQYMPILLGFGLTLVGLWLQRRENRRHEREMGAIAARGTP